MYNWQFIHCLRLWSRVLSEIPSNNTLEPLIYPLVQVTVGVIRLVYLEVQDTTELGNFQNISQKQTEDIPP